MICKECGRELMENDKFCVICGTPNPLFENAEPAHEHTAYTQADPEPAQEHSVYTQPNTEPAQEHPTYTQSNTEPAQEHPTHAQPSTEPAQERPTDAELAQGYTQTNAEQSGYTQPNPYPAQEYQPFPQPKDNAANEYRQYDPNYRALPKERVKHTCSLSVVVFCGIVIFLLSVACGVFAGLYFSAKTAALPAPYSITQQESGLGD